MAGHLVRGVTSVCKALHESICEHPLMSGLRQGPLGAFLATQFMVARKSLRVPADLQV